ncbi:hypothetical protein [Dankookia sp. P2]|uniref:hypothetical protein n=1 Tax=Dankookia sp. P2 TaxID=3423955 RepID=UPI003D67CA10
MKDTEVYLVGTWRRPGRFECSLHSIEIGRGKCCTDKSANVNGPSAAHPKSMAARIHGDLVGIDVPGPQADARRFGCAS